MRVLVRGAGVAGLATAFELARRGAAVTLADTAPAAGGGASRMAGGMLAPRCEAATAGPAVLAPGRLSAEWWETAVPGAVRRAGTLVVAPARDRAELDRFAARAQAVDRLDAEALAAVEPDLAGRFRSALFVPEEAHLDPRAALAALAARLASLGVDCVFGGKAPAGGRFDRIVDCTGMAAAAALPGLRGVRGEMLLLRTDEVRLARPVRLLHPRFPVYVVPRGDGRFMVGATMIESDDAGPPSARSVMELLNAAYALHPAFGEARILEAGVGVRPAFPDNLPRLVESRGVLHVNGFYRHGFLLAPAMAARAADAVFGTVSMETREDETDRQRTTA